MILNLIFITFFSGYIQKFLKNRGILMSKIESIFTIIETDDIRSNGPCERVGLNIYNFSEKPFKEKHRFGDSSESLLLFWKRKGCL